ncbi:MAG: PD-(D/E)XK nuclease family protein [bacterium]|nr:PD-(D/E)XK nuclease family protein [bacterium]
MLQDIGKTNQKIILSGPPGSGKTRRLIEYFNDARKSGREDHVLFIVPDSGAREHLRDIIARNTPDGIPSTFCDKGIQSLQSLIMSLAGSESAGDTHLRAMIEKWIGEKKFDAENNPILKTSGGRDSLARAIGTLRSYGQTVESIKSIPAAILSKDSPLMRGMALWEEWLEDSGRTDERDIIESAMSKVSAATWDMVLIDGFTEIKPLQWKLIRKIIENANKVAVAIDPDQIPSRELFDKFPGLGFEEVKLEPGCRWKNCDDLRWLAEVGLWEIHACRPDSCPEKPFSEHLKIIKAGNPAIEASQLAREVARCIADGYEYRDIAILAPSLGSMYEVIMSEFSRAGIPVRFFITHSLTGTGPGIFVSQLLSMMDGDWDDEIFCALLSNPISGIPKEDASKAIEATCSKYRLGSVDAWINWAKKNTSELTVEFLERFSGLVRYQKIEPENFANQIISIAVQAVRQSWREFPDEFIANEGWAWRAIESNLTQSAKVFSEVFPTSPPSKIAEFLKSELESAKGKPLDRRGNCVNAVTLLGARTWGVKVAMVCGLSGNYFPHKPSRNPFLPDHLRIALDPPLPKYDELRERELALFRIAATRASERLIISWSAEDSSGSPQLPSGPVEKCVEWILDGKMPETVEHNPPKSLDEAVFVSDVASLALENRIDDPGLISRLEDKLKHRIVDPITDEHYEIPLMHEANKLVNAATGSLDRPISPTDLNHLSQCPYRFFAKRALGLADPNRDKVQRGFDNLQWGSIAHNALSEWFREGKTGDFEPLVREAFKKQRELGIDSLSEARLKQIVDALNRFAEFEKNNWPDGFRQVESELVFDTPERRERMRCRKGYDPVEIRIDDDITLSLSGRIDRLDIKNEKIAMVADYKRSGGANKNQLAEGVDLQLACYIELVKRGMGFDVALACFLPLNRIDENKSGNVISDRDLSGGVGTGFFKPVDELSVDGYLEKFRERIAKLIKKLSTGDIAPIPTDKNKCGRSCDYHDLCRFRFSGDDDPDGGGGGEADV